MYACMHVYVILCHCISVSIVRIFLSHIDAKNKVCEIRDLPTAPGGGPDYGLEPAIHSHTKTQVIQADPCLYKYKYVHIFIYIYTY